MNRVLMEFVLETKTTKVRCIENGCVVTTHPTTSSFIGKMIQWMTKQIPFALAALGMSYAVVRYTPAWVMKVLLRSAGRRAPQEKRDDHRDDHRDKARQLVSNWRRKGDFNRS